MEQKTREEEKKRKLIARQDLLRIQKELERFGVVMTEDALMEITPAARQGLLADAKNEAMKAKEDEGALHSWHLPFIPCQRLR